MNTQAKRVIFQDLGFIRYKEAWDYQEQLFNAVVEDKISLRKNEITDAFAENHLLFCEHPPVYTLGKNGDSSHLLYSEGELASKKIDYYHINRGGDITFHGPGQLVGYPIIDLDQFFTDIHRYLRFLEAGIIHTLREYGIQSGRVDGLTGVWIDGAKPDKARKICAMGIKCSHWVTMHGFAFNINADLAYFGHIIPCGIGDKAVTSMEKELGYKVDLKEVAAVLKKSLQGLFGWELIS